ncbi:PREDICTED: ATP-dependent RNA helicase DDX19A-like, partial [Amphimedon queenslandica]|uniref:ATP-dependent RNA helicase n=2 Tax=Amphimedon queenslandica TaxID=400682 RepID=A0AAN0IID0_AMPQE
MADTVNWIQAVHQQEREAQITKSSTSTWPTSGLGFTPAAAAGITQSLRSTTPCTLATIDEEFEDSPLTKAEASLFTKILRKKLVDIYSEVHVVQNDPSSPLYSATTFEELNLHPNLLKGIYSMKFSKPSKIQEKALPLLLADPPQNLIAQSQSGTGKTAAFVLAMLTRVDASKPYPQILCLSPTFDLAQQTGKVLQQMA